MDPVTNYCKAILGENEAAKSALRLIPELADCSEKLLEMIYTYSKPVNLEPGEVLIKEGLFDQWVYFVISGDLEVEIEGKNLGTTSGPIVGERCILGEPRGANLLAGADGLMALGVEMTIIDELNREVNNFQQVAKSDKEMTQFSEDKMEIALELLLIILFEIVGRIIEIHETGIQSFDALSKKRPSLNVQLQSLYTFSNAKFEESNAKPDSKLTPTKKAIGETLRFKPNINAKKEIQEEIDSNVSVEANEVTSPQNISVYNFDDFVDIVYFEILQKHLSAVGYQAFPQDQWKKEFAIDKSGNATIKKAYKWLKKKFKLHNFDLIDITYSVFEVASLYTAAANKSVAQILSISDCDDEKQAVIDSVDIEKRVVLDSNQEEILQKLFLPIEQKLQSGGVSDQASEPGKMSQSDIDALFG